MPAVSAGSCDPIESSLRSSLESASGGGPSSGPFLDDQLISSAKRVLLTKIEYQPAEKEYSASLKTLQSKYIHLNSDGALNRKDENHDGSNVNGSREDCCLDSDGILMPRVVIHSPDNIKLGWLRVYKIGAGLANLGNTCFLNATLQCLTYTPPLVNHLIEFNEHATTCKNVGFCMMCELHRHIRRALEKNGEIIRPQCILQKLKSIAAHMTWGRQEDAHEFLHYMMESMISSSLNGYSTAKLDRVSYETTVVNQIFGGYHRSQVICLRCKEKSDTYDHFMDIMLDIKTVPCLEKALEHFVQPEVLDNENAYMCPNCKQKCPAKKRFTIHRAPNITTFQLKRFDYSRSVGGKITKHVSFPEKFDMRAYMSQRQGPPIIYVLYAVLVHQGVSCNSGHYFCFVRNSNNLWYLMDDSKVRQVSLNVVLSQQAYLLFYTRVSNNGPIKSPLPASNNRQLPTQASSGSNSTTNSTSSNISNGIAGNPVSESFGVPLVRKPNFLASNLVKPKPVLPTTAISTATNMKSFSSTSSSTVSGPLPANRDKIAFDFKSSNANSAQASASPAASGLSNSTSSTGSTCNGGQQQPPERPRLVMQIKHGRVYNYQQSWNSDTGASTSTTNNRSSSSLVPYPPDSSEESDQDTGRLASSPRGGGSNFCAKPQNNPKCSDSLNTKDRGGMTTNRVKMDPQLNATTQVPGIPKLKLLEDKTLQRDSKSDVFGCPSTCASSSSSSASSAGGLSRRGDDKLTLKCSSSRKVLPVGSSCSTTTTAEGQLTVVTNSGVLGAKINATSPWIIADSNQQSPSVASEGSNTSVNSTTDWTVLDTDKDSSTVNAKGERCYPPNWTVITADNFGNNVIGNAHHSTKKSSASGKSDKAVEGGTELRLGPIETSSKTRDLKEQSVGSECETHHQNGVIRGGGGDAKLIQSSPGKKLKIVIPNVNKDSCSPSPTCATNIRRDNCHEAKDVLTNNKEEQSTGKATTTKSSSDNVWCNGVKVPPEVTSGIAAVVMNKQTAEEVSEMERVESDNEESQDLPPLVNGHRYSNSKSPDELGLKRHKKKKKHKKDRESLDEESKWSKKHGKRKQLADEEESCSNSPGRKRRKHSISSESSSSDGYELEWVEKTKETLEEEKSQSQVPPCKEPEEEPVDAGDKHCSNNIDSSLKNGDVHKSSFVDSNSSASTVADLLKKGGHGYGDGVNSWDGGRSMVDRDAEHDSVYDWKRKCADNYNEDFDKGKLKKNRHRFPPPNFISNPFQRVQDLKIAGKSNFFNDKHRWQHFGPHSPSSPYQWEGHHHRGNMHNNHHYNNRHRHYFNHHSKR